MIKIRQGSWHRFSPEIQARLLKLTVREMSMMRETVKDIKEGATDDYKVFVLFEKKAPVAWAITAYDSMNGEYDLHVYTRRDRRRRGYGRLLVKKAVRWVRRTGMPVSIFPDTSNRRFWLSMFDRAFVSKMNGYHYGDDPL